jgi:cytochrome b pre-mRNA-processing protein 3
MGVGDMTVPKRMHAFGEAFYGRSAAYDAALMQNREALARALDKNIFNGCDLDHARRLAGYVAASLAELATVDTAALSSGRRPFATLDLQ